MAVAKVLVIVMSFLIAVLMGLIIWGFYQKSQNPNYKMFRSDDTPVVQMDATPGAPTVETAPPLPAEITPGASFGEISLDLPTTARVISAQVSANRLVLVIARDGQNADLVTVVDMNTGKVLGRVKTTP